MPGPTFTMRLSADRRGFLLLECVVAVLMFSIAVIGLGRCMSDCLEAQQARLHEERARLALENRMVELQASPALPDENKKRELEGQFAGMTMVEHRKTLNFKNEDGNYLSGLHEITLSAEWSEGKSRQTKTLAFYLLRGS